MRGSEGGFCSSSCKMQRRSLRGWWGEVTVLGTQQPRGVAPHSEASRHGDGGRGVGGEVSLWRSGRGGGRRRLGLKGWFGMNNSIFPKCAGVRGSAGSISALNLTLVDPVASAFLTRFSVLGAHASSSFLPRPYITGSWLRAWTLEPHCLDEISALPLTSCVTFAKLRSLSVAEFPHL